MAADLTPIVCVGELLAGQGGCTHDVVRRQFDGSLSGPSAEQMMRVVIAYEPVWAIGTGEGLPQQAERSISAFADCSAGTINRLPKRCGFNTAAA